LTRRFQSLRQKVRGPNARPIATLIAQGDRAGGRALAQFGDVLQGRLGELRAAADGLVTYPGDAGRRHAVVFIAEDLRSSSVTAGRPRLGAILASLGSAVRRDVLDTEILRLHLDAVALVSNPGLPESDYRRLTADLARAVAHRDKVL
jgi:hypothetical protein